MVFGLSWGKKGAGSLAQGLTDLVAYREASVMMEKVANLRKLGRSVEAQQVLQEAERLVLDNLNRHERSLQANMLAAYFYSEMGPPDRAISAVQHILRPGNFQLTEQQKTILNGILLKYRREQPHHQRPQKDVQLGYTTVYSCQNCGRLIHYVSIPCPHCQWSPRSLEEMARSLVLSNVGFSIHALLLLAREVANGRPSAGVVPNLVEEGQLFLQQHRADVERILGVLHESVASKARDMSMVRQCPDCGNRVLVSDAEQCERCQASINWPPAVRLLACMDNLLMLFELRVEPGASNADAFGELVCLLVLMTNNLLRKQESPTKEERQYALQLLNEVKVIMDKNKGAAVDMSDPQSFRVYMFKDNQLEDSESFVIFLHHELDLFRKAMIAGLEI